MDAADSGSQANRLTSDDRGAVQFATSRPPISDFRLHTLLSCHFQSAIGHQGLQLAAAAFAARSEVQHEHGRQYICRPAIPQPFVRDQTPATS